MTQYYYEERYNRIYTKSEKIIGAYDSISEYSPEVLHSTAYIPIENQLYNIVLEEILQRYNIRDALCNHIEHYHTITLFMESRKTVSLLNTRIRIVKSTPMHEPYKRNIIEITYEEYTPELLYQIIQEIKL